jgi:hypothetical protein
MIFDIEFRSGMSSLGLNLKENINHGPVPLNEVQMSSPLRPLLYMLIFENGNRNHVILSTQFGMDMRMIGRVAKLLNYNRIVWMTLFHMTEMRQ